MSRAIFVTGGSSGIGLALCRQLLAEKDCHVFLGARSEERGAAAVKEITDQHPDRAAHLALVVCDVNDPASVTAAAAAVRARSVVLYALVNNAGVGFNAGGDVLATNFYGPKRCSEAFLPLLDPACGRIVNVSSGAASMSVREMDAASQGMFCQTPPTSFEALEEAVQRLLPTARMQGYGLSKAGLTAYTIQQAAAYPHLTCTSLSPGFIDTKMTVGFGATLTPEQGTVSCMRCLFGEVVSGCYYGSDGLRSPLTVTRDPGTPEYGGEENPDATKYNR